MRRTCHQRLSRSLRIRVIRFRLKARENLSALEQAARSTSFIGSSEVLTVNSLASTNAWYHCSIDRRRLGDFGVRRHPTGGGVRVVAFPWLAGRPAPSYPALLIRPPSSPRGASALPLRSTGGCADRRELCVDPFSGSAPDTRRHHPGSC